MTEAEWLVCDDPVRMLECCKDRASERKSRLFAAACSRAFWAELKSLEIERAVAFIERLADDVIPTSELFDGINDLYRATRTWMHGTKRSIHEAMRGVMSPVTVFRHVLEFIGHLYLFSDQSGEVIHRLERQLVRDVFGNPFRSVLLDPVWRTPTAVSLARAAYEERVLPSGELDRTLLSVLADALEDAGCSDAAMLEHCRGSGPHVRGCWVLDALLGKS